MKAERVVLISKIKNKDSNLPHTVLTVEAHTLSPLTFSRNERGDKCVEIDGKSLSYQSVTIDEVEIGDQVAVQQ